MIKVLDEDKNNIPIIKNITKHANSKNNMLFGDLQE